MVIVNCTWIMWNYLVSYVRWCIFVIHVLARIWILAASRNFVFSVADMWDLMYYHTELYILMLARRSSWTSMFICYVLSTEFILQCCAVVSLVPVGCDKYCCNNSRKLLLGPSCTYIQVLLQQCPTCTFADNTNKITTINAHLNSDFLFLLLASVTTSVIR